MIMLNQDWMKVISLLSSLEPQNRSKNDVSIDSPVIGQGCGPKTTKTQVLSFDPQLLQPKKSKKSQKRSKDELNTIGKFCRIFDDLRQSSTPMPKIFGDDDDDQPTDEKDAQDCSPPIESIYRPVLVSATVHNFEPGHRMVRFNMENYRQSLTDLKVNFKANGMREQTQALELLLHFLDDPTSIYMPPSEDSSAPTKENPAFSTDAAKNDVDKEGSRRYHLLTENPQILKELEKSMGVEAKFWKDIFESVNQRQQRQQQTQDEGFSTASDAPIVAPVDPKSTPDLDLMSGRKKPKKEQKTNRQKNRIPKNIVIGLLSGPPMMKLR